MRSDTSSDDCTPLEPIPRDADKDRLRAMLSSYPAALRVLMIDMLVRARSGHPDPLSRNRSALDAPTFVSNSGTEFYSLPFSSDEDRDFFEQTLAAFARQKH